MKSAGATSPRTVNLVDNFPTLVSLTGLESDIPFDGRDLSPLLDNPNKKWPHPSVIEFGRGNAAVRDERWRYFHYSDGSEELYDHQNDPHEWHNLAKKNTYQDIKDKLALHLPATWAADALPKRAFVFDPDNWTFTNKTTSEVTYGKSSR